jgi:carbamoyl-phosphate synthase small subunit
MAPNALLALEDHTLFYGYSNAPSAIICGEVVFNTAMTGYQEVCTDPSYTNQIILFTSSHIGNVGCNREDNESNRVCVEGVLVKEMTQTPSNWRSQDTLPSFLTKNKTPWMEGFDTRKLTRHLRDRGTKNGCLMINNLNPELAIQLAKKHPCASGLDLTKQLHAHNFEPFLELPHQSHALALPDTFPYKIGVIDFGVKYNILRMLNRFGSQISRIPSTTPYEQFRDHDFDGIVLSNGPGDPSAATLAIKNTQALIASKRPLLGICFGCQLISLAFGGTTKKMPFGHHGINHPVANLKTKQVFITSQNHNFVIDETALPDHLEVTHRSLFDGSIQGIKAKNLPIFGFQGHPEGSPGPLDIQAIFEQFFKQIQTLKTHPQEAVLV